LGDKWTLKSRAALKHYSARGGAAYLLILGWRGIVGRRLKGRQKMLEGDEAFRMGILLTMGGLAGAAACIGLIWAVVTGHVR
jgi:hypothetical protein